MSTMRSAMCQQKLLPGSEGEERGKRGLLHGSQNSSIASWEMGEVGERN